MTGRTKPATTHAGIPASHARRTLSTTPAATNGSIHTRSHTFSEAGNAAVRDPWRLASDST